MAVSAFQVGLFLGALAAGTLAAFIASRKNRNPVVWGVLGFAFGVIPVIIVAVLPRNRDMSESSHTYMQPPGQSTHPVFVDGGGSTSLPRQAKRRRRRFRLPSLPQRPAYRSEHISDAAAETLRHWTNPREG
jgi:MFS family permease